MTEEQYEKISDLHQKIGETKRFIETLKKIKENNYWLHIQAESDWYERELPEIHVRTSDEKDSIADILLAAFQKQLESYKAEYEKL